MSDVVSLRSYRNRLRQRELANIRAIQGAGVGEDQILDAMNRWHLGVLEQQLAAGAIDLHLGYARHGHGMPFCVAEAHVLEGKPKVSARESLGAFRSPYFSMNLPEQQRWWCGIVWLEQNRGCPSCTRLAYQFADEEGWPQPKRLGELLGLGETLAPARGTTQTGPRMTRQGFVRQ